ncbi:hypothetical protein FRACYDRAFT_161642, partial [Fragilariopsis cylindrus CCMP1102]
LISGMRTSTFLQRLPFLPKADAYATENGGRIFYPLNDNTNNNNKDDNTFWVKPKHDPSGSQKQLKERDGLLWDFARDLIHNKHFILDTKGYSTCFRVNRKHQNQNNDNVSEAEAEAPPSQLKFKFEDLYNVTTTTTTATAAALELFLSKHCICLCDDDNDLEMALACQHAYLPDISSQSMMDITQKYPKHFTI